jgi:ABC-2 type transport system permease protein
MLTAVRRHLKLIGLYFSYNLAAAMEYRASFITQSLGMILNNAFFLFFWWVIFERVPTIGGYRYRDILMIWALASSSFGFLHVCFGNVRQLSGIIINGELDTYLLQPKDVYINVHASKMSVAAWGDLIYGFILIGLIYGPNPGKLLLFTLFVVAGGLLMGSVMTITDTLTFFIGNSAALTRMATEFLLNFSLYPDSIFRKEVIWIIYTLLPTGFIVFIPCRILQVFSWRGLLGVIGFDLLFILGAYFFFQKGLAKYESGNLITTKL